MIKKKILYICSEATMGLLPYAVNIIRCASQSQALDVYAITIDANGLSYRPYFDDRLASKISFLNGEYRGWHKYVNKFYPAKIGREAERICKEHDIDIIHMLTVDYTCALLVPRLKRLAPVYYTVHDFTPHERAFKNMKERLVSFYIESAVKANIKWIHNLVTNSMDQYNRIRKTYPGKKVRYHIFPSLITGSITGGTDVCPELYDVKNYILFFGTVDEYKGVEFLYDAFRKNEKLSGYRLVIAGSGHIYFPHDNDPRVLFINRYIKDEELQHLFKQSACVVYPYISATQSGVLTLAYKFQTPALVSDISFFREASAGDCCLFFKHADTADLSEQLGRLLFHTDTAKMKAAQKRYYDENYSEQALVSSIEAVY